MKYLFYKLPQNIIECYKWRNLRWQLLAFLFTYISVISGFDWFYFKNTRGVLVQSLLFPPVFLGFFLPVIIPVCLFIFGKVKNILRIINTSYALAQAAIVGLAISSFYKVVTGRVGPHGLSVVANTLIDPTQGFRFGFFRGGAFQGWPSSHTTVAFAMSAVLLTLYPEKKWIKYLSIIYAFYIGIGVSVNIHWFSDFVTGAILGSIIGFVIGKSFLKINFLIKLN